MHQDGLDERSADAERDNVGRKIAQKWRCEASVIAYLWRPGSPIRRPMQLAFATPEDRSIIDAIDHRYFRLESSGPRVAAPETDRSDDEYIVATQHGEIAGYVEISGPERDYPIERFFAREELPMAFDDGLYEVRIVVVGDAAIERPALSLGIAALRAVERRGGTHVVAIARVDLIPFYRKLGLVPLELRLHSGIVEFEVMHASVLVLRRRSIALAAELEMLRATLDWQLPFPFDPGPA